MIRRNLIAGIIIILFILPFVSAGFFGSFWDTITGRATSGNFNVNITVGNNAPEIEYVMAISNQVPTEAGATAVQFWFQANDSDGVLNLDNTTAFARFTRNGAERNASCTPVNVVGSYAVNYSCTVNMWYYDANGTWSVNVSIEDVNGAYGENTTTTFDYQLLTAMVLGPNQVAWPSVTVTQTDILASNSIILNNTGNKNVTAGNIQINATDLVGESNTAYFIPAGNFTSNVASACGGTILVNNTYTAVTGAVLPPGNNTAGEGQEELFFCLEAMPSTLISQAYSTAANGPWTIQVS